VDDILDYSLNRLLNLFDLLIEIGIEALFVKMVLQFCNFSSPSFMYNCEKYFDGVPKIRSQLMPLL